MFAYQLSVIICFYSFFSDALSTALSALYAKMLVIMGIALPITEILSNRIPAEVYQGFYVYLYAVSISFVVFVYVTQLRQKAVLSIIKTYSKIFLKVKFDGKLKKVKFQMRKPTVSQSRSVFPTSEAFI